MTNSTAIPIGWCAGDINAGALDGFMDGLDLIILLGNWEPCPGFEHLDDPPSLAELLDNAGLTSDDWDEFMGIMTGGTLAEKANYLCWMENYFTQCVLCPTCPGRDPFLN